jgi:hypothetical protein
LGTSNYFLPSCKTIILELINLIFRLGVLFAIYGFLWFFIELLLQVLIGGRKRTLGEIYLVKTVKYVFLVNVTFLFCLDQMDEPIYQINYTYLIPSLIILIVYFLGKLQKSEQRIQMMSNFTQGMNDVPFNRKWEIILIILCGFAFTGLMFYPQYSENVISMWFRQNILKIEDAFFFGFIFKVIGFFFLISMFMKMLNALNYIVSGRPILDVKTGFGTKKEQGDDSFDDFEEIDDTKLSE